MQDSTLILISGSSDKTIKLWNIENGTLLNTLKGSNSEVRCLICVSLYKRVAIASASKESIILWNTDTGGIIKTMEEHSGDVKCLTSLEIKGQAVIVSGGDDKTIKIWE